MEVSQLSGMDNDLSTYEVEVANIPCNSKKDDDDDDMGYDPSDVAFIEWLRSKIFNYKTMDYYTMKALWIYRIRGDDEVKLTDEEYSNNEDVIAEVFRIDTDIFDYETPLCLAFNEFNYLLKVDPNLFMKDIMSLRPMKITKTTGSTNGIKMYHGCKTSHGLIMEYGKSQHQSNIRASLSTIRLGVWNGQPVDYEWYEALEDCELKDEALRNKAITEGFINEDDDESRYEQKIRWNIYTNYDDAYEINHDDNEREELCEVRKDLEKEISTKLVECIFSGILCVCCSCQDSDAFPAHNLAHKRNLENLLSKYQWSFSF
ncbi:hypothetical protein Tco_1415201 [Tanacetum coccineum]